MLSDLSLVSDSLSFRSADPDAKVKAVIELLGVTFSTIPFVEVTLARLVNAFGGICAFSIGRVLEPYARAAIVCVVVVVGVVRGVLTGSLVGFATLVAATNNLLVTEGPH